MSNNNNWYDNKALFELINELQKEMIETRNAIKKYNGLYSKLHKVRQDVDEIKAIQEGKIEFGEQIKSWSGWLFALVTLIFMLIKFYLGG